MILDWRCLGYGINEPWDQRSKTKQDQFNKESNTKAEQFLKNDFLPQVSTDFEKILGRVKFDLKIDDEDPQTIVFEYPQAFKSSFLIPSVRLEVGALAAWTPSEETSLSPYLYEHYPTLFKGDFFRVRTVLPERTFWEKATILHHEANRPSDQKIPDRYARHYYDLYCIGNSEYKDKAFSHLDILQKVVDFKMKFYPRGWAKYEEATIPGIRLLPDEYRFDEIKSDYDKMQDMFFGEIPTFEALIQGLRKLESEIHQLKK